MFRCLRTATQLFAMLEAPTVAATTYGPSRDRSLPGKARRRARKGR